MMREVTTKAVEATEVHRESAEFMRTEGVEKRFGIKRGTLYNFFNQRKIRGVVLRQRGNLTGVRLWSVQSIREYIHALMEDQPTIATEDRDILITTE